MASKKQIRWRTVSKDGILGEPSPWRDRYPVGSEYDICMFLTNLAYEFRKARALSAGLYRHVGDAGASFGIVEWYTLSTEGQWTYLAEYTWTEIDAPTYPLDSLEKVN